MQWYTIQHILWATSVLSFVGLFISTKLLVDKIRHRSTMCARDGSGCERVTNSPYSTFLRVPLALWGTLFYLLVLLVSVFNIVIAIMFSKTGSIPVSDIVMVINVWVTSITFSIIPLSGLFSIRLLFLQKKIGAWCHWCVSQEIVAILLTIVSIKLTTTFFPILLALVNSL